MSHKNNQGSALIVTIFITMILMLMAIYLLERIVPIARNVKGIENGNIAYYQAETAVEAALMNKDASNPGTEYSSGITIGNKSWKVSTISSGSTIPLSGFGNSEYDSDWNRI